MFVVFAAYVYQFLKQLNEAKHAFFWMMGLPY